ncbi:MAG: aminotransferase class V-fold PLP-dependent enzyme [Parachlamydia sp.]|nr:aminotransferase class V-fold PLP-dependent enzyme [Parachlamydia sp.]
MPFDIERARKETPGCAHVLHFNNAGAALIPAPVIDAVNSHFQLEIEMGGYEAADLKADDIQQFYASAARLIHCDPAEIAYIENATRAWDFAFYSLVFKPGDKILTAVAEYASNYLAYLQIAKKTGAIIEVIQNDASGQLSLTDLARRMDDKVKLIAVTHIPTNGGLINPAAEVGKIAKAANVFYLLDATQSVGQMPMDVQELGCDALCATGRKYLRGPRGTGFLYVSNRVMQTMEPPFIDLHAAVWKSRDKYELAPDARRFETWETNYSNKLGLKAAIDYALSWGLENTWERVRFLGDSLRGKLRAIPGVSVHDLGERKSGIVTFTVHSLTPQEVLKKLKEKKMNVSVSLAEYSLLDMDQRGLRALVRSSVHYYNTEEELNRFCEVVEAL